MPNSRLISTFTAVPKVASSIVLLVGCLVLVGWMLDVPTLKSVLPGWVTMKANSAITFILSGVSLWLLHKSGVAQPRHRIGQVCAFTVTIIGLLTLSQYLFSWNLGIDQLVFREMPKALSASFPGRMALNTAMNFILIGLALLLLDRRTCQKHYPFQFLTLTAALVSLQPLLSYAYGVESFDGIASYTQMGLHTVLTFVVLCVGILLARPDWGLTRIVTSDSTGGFIARRLLLAAIAIPSVLGWLIVQGYRLGLYNSAFGLSILVMVSIVVFAVWILQNAQTLERIDSERTSAEQALRESEERYRAFIEHSSEGIWRCELEQPLSPESLEDEQIQHFYQYGYLAECNDVMAQMYGFSKAQEIVGVRLADLLVPCDPHNIEYLRAFIQSGYRLNNAESHEVDKQGLGKYFLNNLVGIVENGLLVRAWGSQRDITERKRNQALLAAQTRVLEMIATGATLPEVLDVLVRLIEEQSDEAICSLLLLDQAGTKLGECVAPTLPETYKEAVKEGVAIGPCACSCGTAAYRREPVIVSDIANEPLWADYRDLPLSHGLQACSSMPILSSNGEVLGTFAMYYRTPRAPSSEDWQLVEVSAHLAGIAIERQRAESALKESEERFRKFFEEAPIGISVVDLDGRFLKVNKTYCKMLGYREEELNQLTFAAITHPEDAEKDLAHAEQLFKCEIPSYQIEKRYIKKNGEILWINLTATAICDRDGKACYGLGMVEDITQRKQYQEALQETNQTLQALIQACPLGITVFSLDDGKVKMWNPAAELIFGWSEPEVQGRFLPSVPEDKQDEFLAHLDSVRQGKTLTGVEARRQKKDGALIDISVWAAPLQDAKGNFSCMSIIADISDRKQAEAALKESEERFRKLAEKVRVIPWEVDATTGKFTYVGPQTVEILGYPLSDWYTDNFWTEHIHPEDREWAIQYGLDSSAVLDNYELEYRMLTADGRVLWLYDIVNVVRNENSLCVLRGFMIDITQRKQWEEEREQLLVREQAARSEAEAANRTKDEFLATLSHELRTPLNAMLGWTQMLRTRKLDEATAARALETIDRNTKSLRALIEDVLDVSRIIMGKLHLKIAPVELVHVIEAAIDTLHPAAMLKEIQIESRLDYSVEPILGDVTRLQQVVWNLLSNAVKFTPKGGRVEVRLERVDRLAHWHVEEELQVSRLKDESSNLQPGLHPDALTNRYVQISVSDTGKGIAPDFLPYVFDRFRQENSSTTRLYGGLGLGLAIVRHLVELHGGTVYADSPGEGKGAKFSVQLPIVSVFREASHQSPVGSNS